MSSELPPHPDDVPSDFGYVAADDEEAYADLGAPFETASGTAYAFLTALHEDPIEFLPALQRLTTPESHEAWGDYIAAAQRLANVNEWGMQTRGQAAEGDPDVHYFGVLRGMDGPFAYRVVGEGLVFAALAVTVVNRPSAGGWLVHAMGQRLRPEEVPHDH